jgi:protein-S-isoprenylcysteine O-methyltransferase Ste14
MEKSGIEDSIDTSGYTERRATTDLERLNALKRQVIIRFGLAAILIPVILFTMAGTLHYWQGWVYWAVLLIPMIVAVNYLLKFDPELLERRMEFKEKEAEQRNILLLGNAVLFSGFLAIAIDLRLHGLDQVPTSAILAADAGVFLGYCLVLWVFKVNSYASRTIKVMEGQQVITTGPYAFVRHPMYLGVLVMYMLTPIALGSWWAVLIFSLNIPIFIWRILNEEKTLSKDLHGYKDFCLKRRYRLLPFIW